VRSVPPKAR